MEEKIRDGTFGAPEPTPHTWEAFVVRAPVWEDGRASRASRETCCLSPRTSLTLTPPRLVPREISQI